MLSLVLHQYAKHTLQSTKVTNRLYYTSIATTINKILLTE